MVAALKLFDPATDAFLTWWNGLSIASRWGRPPVTSHDAFLAGALAERESCAFEAECHSGLWDLATIDQIAASIRARGEGDHGPDPVHLSKERYAQLLACEAALRGQEVTHAR